MPLSPFAESKLMDAEDARLLGPSAEEIERQKIEAEYECEEITREERDLLLSIFQ